MWAVDGVRESYVGGGQSVFQAANRCVPVSSASCENSSMLDSCYREYVV